MRHVRYQETYIKGALDHDFQRECASRYEAIKKVLDDFRRPFSVIDIGANMGYFSVRIAEDYPMATVVAVDDKAELPKIVQKNGYDNCCVIPKRFTAAEIKTLAECEAFDVVLALNVLHHMPQPMKALEAMRSLGAILISETPGKGDQRAANPRKHAEIDKALRDGLVIKDQTAHTGGNRKMRAERNWNEKTLTRQSFDVKDGGYGLRTAEDFKPHRKRHATQFGDCRVYLDNDTAKFENMRLRPHKPERRAFVPGMNLWNYKLLGGCQPTLAEMEKRLHLAVGYGNKDKIDDLRPWNCIIAGAGITLIDQGFKKGKVPVDESLPTCIAILHA